VADTVLTYWMSFGVGLAWLYAIGHGFSRHSVESRGLLVALFVSIGLIQLCWCLVLAEQVEVFSWVLYLHQPALFLIGPCLHAYSKVVSGQSLGRKSLWLHMIPALVVAGFSLAQWRYRSPSVPVTLSSLCVAASAGLGAGYVGVVLRRLLQIDNPKGYIRAEIMVLVLLLLIGGFVAFSALLGGLLSNQLFFQVYLSLVTLVMVLSYLLGVKYPELVHYIAEANEAQKVKKYENSTLDNVDVEGCVIQLDRLMQEEHLYQDDSLSLASLAVQLGLSAHQLSELLNERQQVSFSGYLKSLRIEAAKHRLLQDVDEPILTTGLAVGFSSSSAFYSAFRELEGCPPGRFRKQKIAAE
jgi:AraC-like DNA-binding protein